MYNKSTWNYEYPTCFWEEMPWQQRWLFAILASLYFGGGILIGIAALLKTIF